jgi:hypothetical protein
MGRVMLTPPRRPADYISDDGFADLLERHPRYGARRSERLSLDMPGRKELDLIILGRCWNDDYECVSYTIQPELDLRILQTS